MGGFEIFYILMLTIAKITRLLTVFGVVALAIIVAVIAVSIKRRKDRKQNVDRF